jgi:hypothetical protein
VPPPPLVEPIDPFDNEIAVTDPTTRAPTNATATMRGTHFEGFLGAGWSGRGAQPTWEGVAGWVHPVSWPVSWPVSRPGWCHPGGAGMPWVAPGQWFAFGFVGSDT